MSFALLSKEVKDGIQGKNDGIPMGFRRLNRYIGIRKRIYTLIFGATGSGKSSWMHSAYILNPLDWYMNNKDKGIKFKVILFSMERSKIYILAKWVSRKIFIDQGILIPVPKLLGWWDNKLTKEEHDLFLLYKPYIDELLEIVTIIEGAQNPTGIYKYVKKYAEENGKFEKPDEFSTVYLPNHSNEIVIVGEDHLGLTKLEKDMKNKKEAIDKVSEYNQWFRDCLGYTPVAVSQLNRSLSNPAFLKVDSIEPSIDDIKESGRPGEDADVVTSLFDPLRFKTNDPGYKVDKFLDLSTGAKHFRSIKILKNTYGEDDVRLGMAFMGSTGIFKELPKSKDMENFNYDQLFNGQYYL